MLPRAPGRRGASVLSCPAMLDLKYVVENREAFLAMLASRGQSLEDLQAFPGLAGVDPWTLDAEHVDVRPVRDALPTVDVGLVWRRGSGLKPAAAEFIELARESSRPRRA